jgi:hypothetical protein
MIVVRILVYLLSALAVFKLIAKWLWGWFTSDDVLAILVLIVAGNVVMLMRRRRLDRPDSVS